MLASSCVADPKLFSIFCCQIGVTVSELLVMRSKLVKAVVSFTSFAQVTAISAIRCAKPPHPCNASKAPCSFLGLFIVQGFVQTCCQLSEFHTFVRCPHFLPPQLDTIFQRNRVLDISTKCIINCHTSALQQKLAIAAFAVPNSTGALLFKTTSSIFGLPKTQISYNNFSDLRTISSGWSKLAGGVTSHEPVTKSDF